ncbi:hypothetical protein D9M71_675740 [compost metagenome]
MPLPASTSQADIPSSRNIATVSADMCSEFSQVARVKTCSTIAAPYWMASVSSRSWRR